MEESDCDASPAAENHQLPSQQPPLSFRLEDQLREDRMLEIHEQKVEAWLSPMSDHFPTPRGFHFLSAPVLPSSPSADAYGDADTEAEADADEQGASVHGSPGGSPNSSDASLLASSVSPNTSATSLWRNSGASAFTEMTDFDDIYDVSDDEIARKQRLRSSGIVRRTGSSSRRRSSGLDLGAKSGSGTTDPEHPRRVPLPQLTIPTRQTVVTNVTTVTSASATGNSKLISTSPMPPTPSASVVISPALMSFMQHHQAQDVPTISAPPSLDGNMSDDQLTQMSAPPTPVIGAGESPEAAHHHTWTGVQLQPNALATLHSLARSDTDSVSDVDMESSGPVIEVPMATMAAQPQPPSPVTEMAEMAEAAHPQHPLRLITSGLPRHSVFFSPAQQRSLSGLTRLDIPSPSGFFSGLSPRSRHTWHIPGMSPADTSPAPPTSGTAEQFYRLPWRTLASSPAASPAPALATVPELPLAPPVQRLSHSPVERIIEVSAPVVADEPVTALRVQSTPVTARRLPVDVNDDGAKDEVDAAADVHDVTAIATAAIVPATSPVAEPVETVTEIVNEANADRATVLARTATLTQLDRTRHWLMAQRSYLSGIVDLTEAPDDGHEPEANAEDAAAAAAQDAASTADPTTTAMTLVRKKTVRFSEALKSPATPRLLPSRLVNQESAYYRAFTDCMVRSRLSDVFVSRLPRFEALQAQRLLLREAHRNQLLGKYQLTVVPQSAKKRMSANVARGDDVLVDDPQKLRADKEVDALRQMTVTTWHVAALKLLNGGRLISAPVHKRLARMSRGPAGGSSGRRDRARILDLGGQATCDWSWHVALQYPNAKVYSVTTKAIRQLSNANIRGPSNHRQVAVEKLTRLPFEDAKFDLVRATELYSMLKFVGEHGEDEWETCLQECYRVLKPGGYLEFSVLDADLVNAGPLGNAKSVEFGFVLSTLGYDPSPTKLFLSRLDRAGFAETRRAWTCLPMGPKPSALQREAGGCCSSSAAAVVRDDAGAIVPTVQMEATVSGSTDHIAAVTGLAGSWSWERWLLRAEMEKIAGELRLADTVTASPALRKAGKSLDDIHPIIEEGRATGAAWRLLRGYTRKPRTDTGMIDMMLDMGWN